MTNKFIGFLTATLFASIAFAQPSGDQGLGRTFHFNHTEALQDMQEIAIVIRAITGTKQLTCDTEQKILVMHGTADQITLAEWLINELDQPANPQGKQTAGDHKYLLSGSDPDNVVRVFLLTHAETVQNVQEVATVVRSIADIRRAFVYNATRAMVFRGSADQIALAEWMVNNLDTPANVPSSIKRQYQMTGGRDRDNVVRVFTIAHTETIQNLQELATVVRSIGEIRRLFTYNLTRAIAVRGTAEEIGLAEWLINQLDRPVDAVSAGKREYSVPGPGDPDNVVRVFSLAHAGTVQRLQEVAVQVRTMTQVRRIFTYGAPRIIALRGTPGQVEQADQMIRERDQ